MTTPELFERPEWMADAACLRMDTEFFFPERGEDTVQAKAVCRACPVQVDCLDYALRNGETFGCWGGQSERARRRMRRHLKVVPS